MSNSKTYDFREEAEFFEFIMPNGFHYRMRYPTTEEVEEADKLKTTKDQIDFLYKFVTPMDDAAPSIQDALKKSSIKVAGRFSDMILAEFKS